MQSKTTKLTTQAALPAELLGKEFPFIPSNYTKQPHRAVNIIILTYLMKHWKVIIYKCTTCSLHRYCSYSFILQFTVATSARSIHQISLSLIISPMVEIQGINVIETKQGIRLSSFNNWCPPDGIIISKQQVCYSQKSNHNTVPSVVSTILGPSTAIGLDCTGGWTSYQKALLCSHLRLIHL